MKFSKKFILGRKLSMTQVFDKDGVVHPATMVEASPITVTQIKTDKKDGYKAVQVSSKKAKLESKREIRLENDATSKVGDSMDLSQFALGDIVEISSISKGKGFQGVVKRHGFGGGPRSHGQKHSEREPGSIGGGLRNKVPKKMRMAGRMGGDRITVKNLKIVHIDLPSNTIYIGGAVPGRRGTLVEIKG